MQGWLETDLCGQRDFNGALCVGEQKQPKSQADHKRRTGNVSLRESEEREQF